MSGLVLIVGVLGVMAAPPKQVLPQALASAPHRLGPSTLSFQANTLVAHSEFGGGEQVWALPSLKELSHTPEKPFRIITGIGALPVCPEFSELSFQVATGGLLLKQGEDERYLQGGCCTALSGDGKYLAYEREGRVYLWRVKDAFQTWPTKPKGVKTLCRAGIDPFQNGLSVRDLPPVTQDSSTAVPESRPPRVRRVRVEIVGEPVKELRRRLAGFRGCYERLLKRKPDAQGDMTLTLKINDSGGVTHAGVSHNSTRSEGLADCVRGKVRRIRFPAKAQTLTRTLRFLHVEAATPAPKHKEPAKTR